MQDVKNFLEPGEQKLHMKMHKNAVAYLEFGSGEGPASPTCSKGTISFEL